MARRSASTTPGSDGRATLRGSQAAPLLVAAVLVLGVQLLGAQGAGKGAQESFRAVLVRGAEVLRGLPGFGKNAFPALYGEYRVDLPQGLPGGPKVWMTEEALYLAPAEWAPVRFAGRRAFEFRVSAGPEARGPAPAEGRLVVFDRPFEAAGQGAEPRIWSILVLFPAGFDPAGEERFATLFLDKLAYFLSLAKSRSDASFPAVLER